MIMHYSGTISTVSRVIQFNRIIYKIKYCYFSHQKSTMATIRSFSRLLSRQTLGTVISRGYADEMKLIFAAGNQVFYDSVSVKQVDVPSFSGSFGILPKHVPTLAVLKPGVVSVFENEGAVKKIFVSSGTVTINDDSSVQIIAEEAVPVEQLDSSAARDVLSKAQSELSSASTDQAKAEAAIAVEVGEALVKAVE
ncbi:Atp5d [Trypoxylus dichotomus]